MANPKNVEELFLDQQWRRKILAIITKFRIKDDPNDVVMEIFLLMFKREDPDKLGRDYIERWDSSKSGSFSNWVYTFVRNYCIKKYKRGKSKGGRLIEGAVSIVPQDNNKDRAENNTVFADWIKDVNCSAPISTVEITESCFKIATQLRKTHPANSWVEYHKDGYTVHKADGSSKFHKENTQPSLVGKIVKRDLATVLIGLAAGDEPSDIAELFKTSTQFVYSLCKSIRSQPQLAELKDAI